MKEYINVVDNIYSDKVEFHFATKELGVLNVAQPAVFEETLPGSCHSEPLVILSREVIQSLMDQLWNAGFRPSTENNSQGQLAATQAHLTDMRTIVSAKLKVKL